jgi:hypothetical protein
MGLLGYFRMIKTVSFNLINSENLLIKCCFVMSLAQYFESVFFLAILVI